MRRRAWTVIGAVAACAGGASAANVYMMSSGDTVTDNAARAALTSRGHTVTVGVQYTAFDGTQSLAGIDAVYMQVNANWAQGDMPAAGQQALVAWVNGGGRLVTTEWAVWKVAAYGNFVTLGPVLPLAPTTTYTSAGTTTLTQVTPNAALNAGLPAQFTCPLTSIAGTETLTGARPGATVYYTSSNGADAVGLAGWGVGSGFVFSFSTVCGEAQTSDPNFGRLLANAMGATAPGGCYANCDGSTQAPVLNVLDFNCFLNAFSAGQAYANCDGSTQVPVLNVLDFNCFLNRFSAGCP